MNDDNDEDEDAQKATYLAEERPLFQLKQFRVRHVFLLFQTPFLRLVEAGGRRGSLAALLGREKGMDEAEYASPKDIEKTRDHKDVDWE